jgi:hypothetical protein
MGGFFNKLSQGDFSAILAPGFFIFLVLYSCVVSSANINGVEPITTFWEIFSKLGTDVGAQPFMAVFILFASFMLGSVCRALPVGSVERSIRWFKFPKSDFPRIDAITKIRDTMIAQPGFANIDVSKLPDVPGAGPMYKFNYWKDELSVHCPNGFSHYQAFENRSRLFCGVILAAWIGVAGGIYLCTVAATIGVPFLIVSAIFLIIFGLNFRRVRGQEAVALFAIYAAYLQGPVPQPAPVTPAPPNPATNP